MNSTERDLVAVVVEILERVLSIDAAEQRLDKNSELLGALPGFDSQSVITLLLEVENEFDIQINDDAVSAETFETVGALADFIASSLPR